jgi:hypothetical protein
LHLLRKRAKRADKTERKKIKIFQKKVAKNLVD